MLSLFAYFFSSITLAQFDNGIVVSDTQNYLPHAILLSVTLSVFQFDLAFDLKLFVMINDLRQL
mgnify:CR=1 FL=1